VKGESYTKTIAIVIKEYDALALIRMLMLLNLHYLLDFGKPVFAGTGDLLLLSASYLGTRVIDILCNFFVFSEYCK
jgi:hypothetical protein